jgi:hypothetical protein
LLWLISERVTIVTGRSVICVRRSSGVGSAPGAHSRISVARSLAPSRHWLLKRSSTSASLSSFMLA